MENNRQLGPRSGAGRKPLSASRAGILDRLRDQPEPITLAALVRITALHENTIREHLEALVHRGLVRRTKAEPHGRGRPAWLYELSGESESSEYAGLATALASAIARTSSDPHAAAVASGEEWGHQLAAGRSPARELTADAARAETLDMLDDLGFAPEPDETDTLSRTRLTRCPLLEAAHRHPDIVCAVHLGIVRGALEEHGMSPDGTDLIPFAEPGACHLVVPPTPPPA
ncbi:helix-turn-helix transcriptional regulator [Nocardioides jensenii]|uniref:helix-turn-helix transcriptional regulator n=1 Tax=Nocardioides jensenii TaxID=1843 RepID=UPI0008363F8F|nr:helix-turn-helix domain-containing protein [Nocardioides jensenii]